ncbi:crosslink repair DNA glycosylase YcaQ family protein, partial [Georgenia sp. 10Sc9-8]|nr:crosslink repair DNA glycosylase YcaQ family protein [Georgenia halotolerans]
MDRTWPVDATAEQVLRHRWRAQQLDREHVRAVTDVAVLDLGVQDGPGQAAAWALTIRGAQVDASADAPDGPIALAWTVRGAPHHYRRADLPAVQVAVSPFTEADAARRIYDAAKPLRAAGVPIVEALRHVAVLERDIVVDPSVKGDVSTALTRRVGAEYLRYCRPCQATHLYEMPFRLAALHAGLELVPGTSPPVLRRVAAWPRREPGPAAEPGAAPPGLQVLRAYLRLLGPTTPTEVAAYLDAPVTVVKEHWPADAVEVGVLGSPAWVLPEDLPALVAAAEPPAEPVARLLSGVDLFTAAKDRALLVPDPARRKEVWPVLGRPGTLVIDGA